MKPPHVRLAVLGFVALLAGSCGGADPAPDTGASPDEAVGPELTGELLVSAAASLTDVFAELGAAFAAEHPEVEVVFNLGSSSGLATQLVEGAPSDVFAAADMQPMEVVAAAGLVDDPAVFATNRLEIVVEPGNPLGITGLADLARDDVILVLAGEEVPAGRYAAEVLDAAGVRADPASLELDVRAVLGKVATGEADVGIVYHSDVVAGGERVEGVAIPAEANVVAEYPIAVLETSQVPELSAAFVEVVEGPEGRQALRAGGFGPA